MKTISLRSVRYAYVTFLMTLAAFAALEPVVGRTATAASRDEGLSTCGTIEQPCALETLTVAVKAPPRAPTRPQLAEGLSVCGTEAEPCPLAPVQVMAERSPGHLAATERTVGMTLRVRS